MTLRTLFSLFALVGSAGLSFAAMTPAVTFEQINGAFGLYAAPTSPGVSSFQNNWGTFAVRVDATGAGGSVLVFNNIEQVLTGTLVNATMTDTEVAADVVGLSLLLRDRTTKFALLTINMSQGEFDLSRPNSTPSARWTGLLIDSGPAVVTFVPGPLMQAALPGGILLGDSFQIRVDGPGVSPLQNGAVSFIRGNAYFSASARLDFFCRADLNDDGYVDDSDFVVFTQSYEAMDCGTVFCRADLDDDGDVDDADFVLFSRAYDQFECPGH